MKKQKLALREVRIQSFITDKNTASLRGGSTNNIDCPTDNQCTFPLCDLKPATEDTNCDTGCTACCN